MLQQEKTWYVHRAVSKEEEGAGGMGMEMGGGGLICIAPKFVPYSMDSGFYSE